MLIRGVFLKFEKNNNTEIKCVSVQKVICRLEKAWLFIKIISVWINISNLIAN